MEYISQVTSNYTVLVNETYPTEPGISLAFFLSARRTFLPKSIQKEAYEKL